MYENVSGLCVWCGMCGVWGSMCVGGMFVVSAVCLWYVYVACVWCGVCCGGWEVYMSVWCVWYVYVSVWVCCMCGGVVYHV